MLLFFIILAAVFFGIVLANKHIKDPAASAAAVLRFRYGLKYTVLTLIALAAVVEFVTRMFPS